MSHSSKGYVSELDQFLMGYDTQHPVLSAAQKQEKEKYKRINQLRDTAKRLTETPLLQEWF